MGEEIIQLTDEGEISSHKILRSSTHGIFSTAWMPWYPSTSSWPCITIETLLGALPILRYNQVSAGCAGTGCFLLWIVLPHSVDQTFVFYESSKNFLPNRRVNTNPNMHELISRCHSSWTLEVSPPQVRSRIGAHHGNDDGRQAGYIWVDQVAW
jgi:hypothetical protein